MKSIFTNKKVLGAIIALLTAIAAALSGGCQVNFLPNKITQELI